MDCSVCRASMGPRLFSRGRRPLERHATLGPTGFNGAAALQPRKVVGEDHTRAGTVPASMGPRLFSRGRVNVDLLKAARFLLQWGRGSSAAEGEEPHHEQIVEIRFNGAAALQPRKAFAHMPLDIEPPCFNGAAALQPRKEHPDGGSGSRHPRFNGAAALQPRKGSRHRRRRTPT